MLKTLLIAEDDQMLQNLMAIYFKKAGFHVITSSTGKEALEKFKAESPCFLVLDLMLPEMSGEEVCHHIREVYQSDVPIIMVTAKVQERERINGLKMGADDYVTKPFSPEELVVRVETILRRANHHCQKIKMGNLTLKPRKHEVWNGDTLLNLTASEFAILKELMQHPDQVLSREQLLYTLYPLNEKVIYERTIDVHVKHIREQIGDESLVSVQTVRGVGYRFVTTDETE
ncbi:response regulator transcription factor [Priestia aryabhattai]|uniref:response regulator transcription factor n=1 Tax=Priestia aryabhattai TaxID=412384 RepID=UPI0023804C78|nr:response regulator transcription factor [Priestia aryabhattai]WDW10732.1 response regulator transcription factor [Priestia aryabhattai]